MIHLSILNLEEKIFDGKLISIDGSKLEKLEIKNEKEAGDILKNLDSQVSLN